jgi:hypothetical protein
LNDLSSSSYSEEQSGLELSTEQALCCEEEEVVFALLRWNPVGHQNLVLQACD